jgi:hypothetical protein
MSKIEKLQQSYKKFIDVPWKSDIAPAQRVIFCVYNEHDELSLRAKVDEFELATKQSTSIAAKELEPKTQTITLPKRTLKSAEDVEDWIEEVSGLLSEYLTRGPIILR